LEEAASRLRHARPMGRPEDGGLEQG